MNDDDVNNRPPTRALTEDECWQRIAEAPFGRVAAAAAGEVDIFPVNHAVDSHGADARTIVFRTSAGTKLLELTIHSGVAFEVDGFTDTDAFSVVVKGIAQEFDRRGEVAAAEKLGVTPWAPEEKTRWVRITPTEVNGRTFQRRQAVGA
ncbi:pyridoxamine 5'-phosphate oxidase family protein [Agromyces sp. NPDC049794]|uniref:pyridoxamine 5'-phosphate oxidase family protein n=1 Tax=unclassified Agromyces TaxID=2639701 RepID=UPI0033C474B6